MLRQQSSLPTSGVSVERQGSQVSHDDGEDGWDKQRRQAKKVNYQEFGEQDSEFEKMLMTNEREFRANKKRKVEESGLDLEDVYLGTDQVEQETAWAADFSAMAIVEEEEELLPSKASELSYVKMRNYILSKWRANVDRYLPQEEAMQGLQGSQRAYAEIAWRFLETTGFINFGVAQNIASHVRHMSSPPRSIIIIGAGIAGLAAAQMLKQKGHRVLVLEGHARPGGRVYTKKLKAGNHEAVADLGGSILTGIDGNPLAILAKQLRIPMHEIEQTQVPIYLEDGTLPAKELDEQVEQDYNKLLDACSDFRDNLGEVADHISLGIPLQQFWEEACLAHRKPPESGSPEPGKDDDLRQRFFNWHLANLEFANAASVKELSVRSWDQDDPHELPGAHCFLPGGNIRLVAAMTEGLKILYNTKLKQIRYSKQEVIVQSPMHKFKGDAVLVTVPLGVLKKGDIKFEPPLTARKQQAIQRIGFGLLNKIVLVFPHNFWGHRDMFGRLPELNQKRGEGYLFYSYSHISGASVLTGLISGDAAKEFEERSLEESTRRVMAMLQGIFEPKGITIPAPLQVCCTRWGKDEMARGSYSSMAVGALGGEDYDILGESLGGRVFFAGESTTRKYPATMHGAFQSGTREAANIIATLDKDAADAKLAKQEREKTDQEKAYVPRPLSETPLYQQAAELWLCLQDLELTFKDPCLPPDKEFGCFSAIVGPPESSFGKRALLRVDVGAAKGRAASKHTPAVLVSLPIRDLQRLQDVSGGDEPRLSFLAGLQSVKLVGRAELLEPELRMLHELLDYRKAKSAENATTGVRAVTPAVPSPQAAPRPNPLPVSPQRKAPEPHANRVESSLAPQPQPQRVSTSGKHRPLLNSLPKEY